MGDAQQDIPRVKQLYVEKVPPTSSSQDHSASDKNLIEYTADYSFMIYLLRLAFSWWKKSIQLAFDPNGIRWLNVVQFRFHKVENRWLLMKGLVILSCSKAGQEEYLKRKKTLSVIAM